jgi:C-terminal processing protease CtpA/Prc
MRKVVLTILGLTLTTITYCQMESPDHKFNLDFEHIEKGRPLRWDNFGSSNYSISLDSIQARSGKYSAVIEFIEGNTDFKAWAFTLPDNYAGKKITLTGYLKTENVSNGYAGLWMRIDPGIAFDNMNKNGVTGTTGWTKYEITLDMAPEKTRQIVVGGLLVGKGKMWVDDLQVTVDGKDIKGLKPFERKLLPADKDNEFNEGSKIVLEVVNEMQIENLKALGLIWGFLKYHHPSIAKGNFNWDYELFRILPSVVNDDNKKSRDESMVKWINSLGPFSIGRESNPDASLVKIKPDLDWITKSGFSAELTSLLLKVKKADRPKDHYYIGLYPDVNNPEFKNEKEYAAMKYPDTGFRILTLFRYWSIIQYYFPYKNLIEEDWKGVLEEFIPKFVDASNETEYTLTVLELIGRIHDTHANILGTNEVLSNFRGSKYTAVELTFVENKPVVTGCYSSETCLTNGDIVLAINNKPVGEIIKERLKYTPASNYPTQLRDIARNLLRTNDSIISLQIIRDGNTFSKTVKASLTQSEINTAKRLQSTDTSFKLIANNIAYIHNGALKKSHLPIIWKHIQYTKGLIIDIRNYPSDFPIYDLSGYLMPDATPFVKFTNGSVTSPGLFTYTKSMETGRKNKNGYKGKVVILINEITQSSAEFHAMAYRVHPNAVVIGSTTAAADGNVSRFNLPGGITTRISGIGVYYPDGKETQRIGIVPDIEVKLTIEGIKNGRDELFEKALEIIKGQ